MTVCHTREAFPQGDLGHDPETISARLSSPHPGHRAENLEAAIKAYEAALTVYAREAFPQDRAMTQNNLGIAYRDSIQGGRRRTSKPQ